MRLIAEHWLLQDHHNAHEASEHVLRQHPVQNVMTHVDLVVNGVLVNE